MMRDFSLQDVCTAAQNCFDHLGVPGSDKVSLRFSASLPPRITGEEKALSNLLGIIILWIRSDSRIERTEIQWSLHGGEGRTSSLEGEIRILSGQSSAEAEFFRSLTANSSFLTFLHALKGEFFLPGGPLLTFSVPLASSEQIPSDPIRLKEMTSQIGDPSLCLQLIGEYIKQTESRLSELTSCLDEGNSKQVHRIAHCIKGGALNICAQRLNEAAAALEREAKTGNLSNGARLLSEIHREFLTVSDYFAILSKENAE